MSGCFKDFVGFVDVRTLVGRIRRLDVKYSSAIRFDSRICCRIISWDNLWIECEVLTRDVVQKRNRLGEAVIGCHRRRGKISQRDVNLLSH